MSDADAPAASSPPPSPSSALDTLIDDVAGLWKRAARSSRRALDGMYTVDDALSDIGSWMSVSAACALRLAQGGRTGDPPPGPALTADWSATMTVLPSVLQRPLTLGTDGLRAIGMGDGIRVRPSAVTFDPAVLTEGVDAFTIRVSFSNIADSRTLVFEGDVNAVETGAPVSEPVRPNNRDGGPVR